MKSPKPGTNTSEIEVTQVDSHGIWVYVKGREYFLPHTDFPWFQKASLQAVLHVELYHGLHLHWPELDVDLSLDSLENPDHYPRVAE